MFEVKAHMAGKSAPEQLQDAIDHSSKDYLRLSYTLNKVKQMYRVRSDFGAVHTVSRFQARADNPFGLTFGAVAVLSEHIYDSAVLVQASSVEHSNSSDLELMVVRGADLMRFVHEIYRRAADEA